MGDISSIDKPFKTKFYIILAIGARKDGTYCSLITSLNSLSSLSL